MNAEGVPNGHRWMLTQIHMQSKVWVTGPLAISTAEKIFANVPRGLVARPMRRIAPRRSEKLYLIVALAIRFAIAAISQTLGLSLAVGAFPAAMIVAASNNVHNNPNG
jgi:Kef-type K+ transport system membrane component KefB